MNSLNRLLRDLPWTFPHALSFAACSPQTLFTMRRPQFPLPRSLLLHLVSQVCELVKSQRVRSGRNVPESNGFIMVNAYSICCVVLSAEAPCFRLTC